MQHRNSVDLHIPCPSGLTTARTESVIHTGKTPPSFKQDPVRIESNGKSCGIFQHIWITLKLYVTEKCYFWEIYENRSAPLHERKVSSRTLYKINYHLCSVTIFCHLRFRAQLNYFRYKSNGLSGVLSTSLQSSLKRLDLGRRRKHRCQLRACKGLVDGNVGRVLVLLRSRNQ